MSANTTHPRSYSSPIDDYTKIMTISDSSSDSSSDSRMIILSKQDAGKIIDQQRQLLKLSWSSLAEAINKPKVWATAALLGQHALSENDAVTITSLLKLDADLTGPMISALQQIPHRGQPQIPADPTIYRFYEALGVYGEALKALIHEEFGDGIMSAINFGIDIAKKDDPSGARVVVTFNGKFLDYHWPTE